MRESREPRLPRISSRFPRPQPSLAEARHVVSLCGPRASGDPRIRRAGPSHGAISVFRARTNTLRCSTLHRLPALVRRCSPKTFSTDDANLPRPRPSDVTRSEHARNSHAHVNAAGIAHAALTTQAPAHVDEAYPAVILFTPQPIAFTRLGDKIGRAHV